jgi:hypothetical protein
MNTRFLNVDLDVWSSEPLESLVVAFGGRVFVLRVGKEGRRYAAHLELSSQRHSKKAGVAIMHFVRLIKKLPRRERQLWNRASSRQFNIGIASGPEPYEVNIESKVVAAVSSVDGEIVVTCYAPEPPPNSSLHRA